MKHVTQKIAKGQDLTDDDRVILGQEWLQKHSTEEFKTLIFWNYAINGEYSIEDECDNYEFVLALQKIFPQFYKKIPPELLSVIGSSESSEKYVREGGFKQVINQAIKDIGKEQLAKFLIKNDINLFRDIVIKEYNSEGEDIAVILSYQSMIIQWTTDKVLHEESASWDEPAKQYHEGSEKADEKLKHKEDTELKQAESRLEQALAEEKRITEEFKTATWPLTEKLKGQAIENGNIIERLRAKITKLKQVKKD
jgi:hypothetical protein